jgi:ABC-type polysaccharide/polyol phosphate transport system ATPase subunit
MSQFSIRVEGLSKLYRIGLKEQMHETLGGAAVDFLRAPVRNFYRLRGLTKISAHDSGAEDVIWAIRDLSFEVKEGEVLGIIGANGAGKSTLLKVLADITEPTFGRAIVRGRVATLLEVGTGFHPELTGRENVYLNGTILGMSKAEIDSKFDEIVAFSDVEEFIDTPVKRFSSGMRVRLAFSVAAHLESEILFIDEVLAVGDARFQQRCLDRMAELAGGGRTVLFVSHNIGALSRLCTQGIVLERGSLVCFDKIHRAVAKYADILADVDGIREEGGSPSGMEILDFDVGVAQGHMARSKPITARFRLRVNSPFWKVVVQLGMTTFDGAPLVLSAIDSDKYPELCRPGVWEVETEVPPLWLQPLTYPMRIKIVAHPDQGTTERFYSPWAPLAVAPEPGLDVHTAALLAPEVRWRLRDAKKGRADGGPPDYPSRPEVAPDEGGTS